MIRQFWADEEYRFYESKPVENITDQLMTHLHLLQGMNKRFERYMSGVIDLNPELMNQYFVAFGVKEIDPLYRPFALWIGDKAHITLATDLWLIFRAPDDIQQDINLLDVVRVYRNHVNVGNISQIGVYSQIPEMGD